MKIKVTSISVSLYLLAYTLFIVSKTINNSMIVELLPDMTLTYIRWLIVWMVLFACITKVIFTIGSFFKMILFVLIGFVIYINCGNADYLCTVLLLFLLLGLDVPVDKIMKTAIYTNLLMLLLVFGACFFGLVEDKLYQHSILFGFGQQTAHTYGFKYYSGAPFIILYVSMMVLYYKRNIRMLLFTTVINTISFLIFTAKLPYVIFIMTMLFYYIISKTNFLDKKVSLLHTTFEHTPGIFMILSFLVCYLYKASGGILRVLNILLSTRISLGHTALVRYGISILGQRVVMQGSYTYAYGNYDWDVGNFYIDNEYLYMLIVYGAIFTLIILTFFVRFFRYTVREKEIWLFVWCFATAIFALVNNSILAIQFNPILLIGICVTRDRYKEKTELWKL